LLSWQRSRPISAFFSESIANEVSRLVDCPVAVAAISESPAKQVVLAISRYDLHPSRSNALRTAISLAASSAAHKPLVVGPVNPDLLTETGITLPDKAEYQPEETGLIAWVTKNSEQDSLIMTISHGRAFDRTALEIYQTGRSVVTVSTNKAPNRI
jgi:hypothetical protein